MRRCSTRSSSTCRCATTIPTAAAAADLLARLLELRRQDRHRPHPPRPAQARRRRCCVLHGGLNAASRPRSTRSSCSRAWSASRSDEAEAGDIVLINGIDEVGIGATLCDLEHPDALPLLKVDEPTLTMNFLVNTSPLAGREGKYVTSRQIRERLERETARATWRCASRTPSDADMFIVSRPRRAAPHDPAREHAPRRLRARGVAPARGRARKSTACAASRTSCSRSTSRTRNQGAVMEELGRRARRAAGHACPTARAACASTTASRRAA